MVRRGEYGCHAVKVLTVLDCSITNLFKLRPIFPGIPSPLHDSSLELAKGGAEREVVSITLKLFTVRWGDRLMGGAGRPQLVPALVCLTSCSPWLWHCCLQQPQAHHQMLGDRTARAVATQGQQLPESLHSLSLHVSLWQLEVVGYSAFLLRLSTHFSAPGWMVSDSLITQLSLWDFSCSTTV